MSMTAKMANPVGQDSWVAYVEEEGRSAKDLEQRVGVLELFKRAVGAEPDSLKVWHAYCEYYWALYIDCQSPEAGWPDEELAMGREIFSLDQALALWQEAYEAIKYRLSDSHTLWDRWLSLEMEQLVKTKTPEGIKRVTHLYRDRLQIPHMTWDDTSQSFSGFLSEYNRSTWEDTMMDVTSRARDAKRIMAERVPFELKLSGAGEDEGAQRAVLKEYLEWETIQSKRNNDDSETAVDICRALFARALTGVFAADDTVWNDYIVYLSTSHTKSPSQSSMLDVFRRAVDHCPWSGTLWSRYILCAEEGKLSFTDIEKIKHTATNNPELYKGGLTGLLDLYVAWCGFLKRTAMDINATDEDVDIADVGLYAALEDVEVLGKRTYGKDYKGDPSFRLERIYIQYLTEKKGYIDEARGRWDALAGKKLHADSYDFWLNWYLWEMMIFGSNGKDRSPTPSSVATGLRVPANATAVLARAVNRKTLDWPERIMEIYLQHCNDYEHPGTVRRAIDTVHRARKGVAKRREREAAEASEAYAAQVQAQTEAGAENQAATQDSPSSSKRKREATPEKSSEKASKRARNEGLNGSSRSAPNDQSQRRDRENTTVLVSNLPTDVTQTKVRQYFKEYGHINNMIMVPNKESSTAVIEFRTAEDARSALLRDGKYFASSQITVEPGTDLTVFVTNYPPTADERYIRNMFKECGDILSVRMPSLRFNTHRRFAYVTFRNRSGSAKAVELDGEVLEGRYQLETKYSDPSQKKSRDGAISEGREVVIKRLDLAATQDDVRDVFSKYGEVSSVRILKTAAGKSKGTAFVVFESKEQAGKAVEELDKTKFRNQILSVEISIPSNFKPVSKTGGDGDSVSSPAPSKDGEGDEAMVDENGAEPNHKSSDDRPSRDDIKARTISVMGLPDTVNDARVRALVETIGEVSKIVLQPNHGGATIEFADASATGRAALQLDGRDFEGRKLRTGTVAELHRERGEKRVDRIVYGKEKEKGKDKDKDAAAKPKGLMPPPPSFRRPILGKAGAKRGLGFVSAPKKSADADVEVEKKTNGEPKAMKSNADFKAMFLSGKEKGAGEQEAKNGS
jgi:squamous cell carcinoma antigen recognized by T-cells 3